MGIDEFRKEFLERIRSDASLSSTDPNDEFIQYGVAALEEYDSFPDPDVHYYGSKGLRGRIMQFNAFAFDEADGSLCLLISEFTNTDESIQLTNTRIDELYMRMRYFVEEAYRGDISKYCDDSDRTIDIARKIKRLIGQSDLESSVLKFKFFIITNAQLSSRVKYIKKENLFERPVEINIWHLERFYELYNSENSEAIEIDVTDFDVQGIQCLKANMTDCDEYDAYLAIVPGKFLADIYLKYGSRLLQGNVRAFLSLKNNVNKGIRKTIITEPEKFFTYNNGIATIAQSISLSADGTHITAFKDLQIINGGQTTASMASAVVKKDNESLANIFVPMKLTVLNYSGNFTDDDADKTYQEMIRKISEYANSQTKVTAADFFSNHKFHVDMEKLAMSAKNAAPPVNGNPFPTTWFYERSRGKWDQEQMKMTRSQRDKYVMKYPKRQVVKKEQLAKCLNIIRGYPYVACDNATNNMKLMAPYIDDICNNRSEQINDYFFKQSICAVIIFKDVETMIAKQPWYPTGGNRAQIVPYSIAKILSCIPSDKSIDYDLIWKKQRLYPSFVGEVEKVAYLTHCFLNDSGGVIAREYARHQKTWEKFRDDGRYVYQLSSAFIDDLTDLKEIKEEKKRAGRERKFNDGVDLSVKIFNLGYDYWSVVYDKVEKERVINFSDKQFVKSMADIIRRGNLPSTAQAKRLVKIYNVAEDAGIILE